MDTRRLLGIGLATVILAALPRIAVAEKANAAVSLTPNVVQLAQPVVLAAIVTLADSPGAYAGGTVDFTARGSPISGCSGVPVVRGAAWCRTIFSQLAVVTITVAYSGDANTEPASSSVQLTVEKADAGTYIASSVDSAAPADVAVFGEPVMLGALLLEAPNLAMPTGTVTFSDGATALGTVPVGADGHEALTVPSGSLAPLSVGKHLFSIAYSGDSNYLPSSTAALPLTITVSKASTIVAVASTPPQAGQPVTLKAAVTIALPGSGTPGGTVSFTNGGNAIAGCAAIPTQNGIATCTTSFPQLGGYAIAANYSGDANTSSGTAAMQLTVARAVAGLYTASTPGAPVYGTPVTVTALVTGATGLAAPTYSDIFGGRSRAGNCCGWRRRACIAGAGAAERGGPQFYRGL